MKPLMQVDAFPGDIVIFARVINLLRGMMSESYYINLTTYMK